MSGRDDVKFRRLMIAQDTGSAIVGPARADIYYGAGDEAGRIAGRLRNPGKFAMLMPRELDPAAAGAKFPLPAVRPNVEEILAKLEQERVKAEAEKAAAEKKAAEKVAAEKAAAEKAASAKPAGKPPAPATPETRPTPGKKPAAKPETSRAGSGA